jgi:hypothetical protein
MGYRTEFDAPDERPLLVEYACTCAGCREHQGRWRDETERMTYEAAVESCPKREDEGPLAYAARISAVVEGKYKRAPVAAMPHARMSRVERDRQLQKLRGQMPRGTEVL